MKPQMLLFSQTWLYTDKTVCSSTAQISRIPYLARCNAEYRKEDRNKHVLPSDYILLSSVGKLRPVIPHTRNAGIAFAGSDVGCSS